MEPKLPTFWGLVLTCGLACGSDKSRCPNHEIRAGGQCGLPCNLDADCTPGQICSAGICQAGGGCQNGCVIGGTCVAASAPNPANACALCDPATSSTTWSQAIDGAPCGAGQRCLAGVCGGSCATPVASLSVSGFSASASSGVSYPFSVTALDGSGQPVACFAGVVHFSSSCPFAALPLDYTFASGDQGTKAFSASLTALAAHVQSAVAVGSASLTATFSQAVAAGDLLVGEFRSGSATVSDNVNGAWTLIFEGNSTYYLGYLENSKAAPAGALTVTLGSGGALRMSIDEFSGIVATSALDMYSIGMTQTGATTFQVTASLPAPAGELVYAGGGVLGTATYSAGTTDGVAMTMAGQISDSSFGSLFSEYALSSAAGAQDSTVISNSVNGGGQATFKVGSVCAISATDTISSATGSQTGIFVHP